jgi:hypothetical protein
MVKRVSLLAFSLAFSVTMAFGDELKTTPVMLEDGKIVQAVVMKHSFAERHPKLHKVGRKVRRTCQVMLPVLQAAGAAAQVVYAIR